MIKRANASENWVILDTMRGLPNGQDATFLIADDNVAEATQWKLAVTSTGFSPYSSEAKVNASGSEYIYMAVRRDDQSEVTDATKVFSVFNQTAGNGTGNSVVSATVPPFPIDLLIHKWTGSRGWDVADRMRGKKQFFATNSTSAEFSEPQWLSGFDRMAGYATGSNGGVFYGTSDSIGYFWKRAKSYFDVVAYSGTGANRTVAHNLGVVPEMIWIKHRSGADNWIVGHKAFNWLGPIYLNEAYQYVGDNIAWWNNTAPTSTEFTIGTGAASNTNTGTYIAYLFATLAGVSKVGSYTGNSNQPIIDCGFTNGARFIMIKRTDAAGDWYIFDSVRGYTDPDYYILLNSTASQSSLSSAITPKSQGFMPRYNSSEVNTNGASYIFYAIA